jgi:hypothetical protein
LLCDDVVALEMAGGSVLAHPAPPVVNLRVGARPVLGAPATGYRELGRDAEAIRLEIGNSAEVAPLRALYLLDRSARHPRLTLEPADGDTARMLLASSFNFIVTDAARLERQLNTCAGVARAAKVTWVRAPVNVEPMALASALALHATAVTSCAA